MALQQIVEQVVTGLGYDLVEIERSAGGLLRITIDLPWVAPATDAPAPLLDQADTDGAWCGHASKLTRPERPAPAQVHPVQVPVLRRVR